MYTGRYMGEDDGGFWDSLTKALPSITQSAGNLINAFRPQQYSSNISTPYNYQYGAGTSSLSSMLPILLIGGLAVFAIMQMREK